MSPTIEVQQCFGEAICEGVKIELTADLATLWHRVTGRVDALSRWPVQAEGGPFQVRAYRPLQHPERLAIDGLSGPYFYLFTNRPELAPARISFKLSLQFQDVLQVFQS